jgi:hypothetical protein
MQVLLALAAGLVFGAGLTLSHMVDPAKVLAFLDFGAIVKGAWDPSLALVMGGALLVAAPAFAIARNRAVALSGNPMQLPTRRRVDRRLAAGALLFGIGWGLVGFCPGPAVAALGLGGGKALVFFIAMAGGMLIFQLLERQAPAGSLADQLA